MLKFHFWIGFYYCQAIMPSILKSFRSSHIISMATDWIHWIVKSKRISEKWKTATYTLMTKARIQKWNYSFTKFHISMYTRENMAFAPNYIILQKDSHSDCLCGKMDIMVCAHHMCATLHICVFRAWLLNPISTYDGRFCSIFKHQNNLNAKSIKGILFAAFLIPKTRMWTVHLL